MSKDFSVIDLAMLINECLFPFSGLRKAKEYDWKDSNMALFGSDTDKRVKSK